MRARLVFGIVTITIAATVAIFAVMASSGDSRAYRAVAEHEVPGSKIEMLAGGLEMQADCGDARAVWKIDVDGRLLEQGTLRPDRELDLTTVSIPPRVAPRTVRITTARLDSAECEATFRLVDPGFEGAGHGRFRFKFPEFGEDP